MIHAISVTRVSVVLVACAGVLAGAGRSPGVFLDHVYVVVDSAAYGAMVESPALQERFAMSGVRTNATGDRSWTAIGVGGEHTYIEIFPSGERYGPAGGSGIAFSVGRSEHFERVSTALGRIDGATLRTASRAGIRDGVEIPWFRSVSVEHDAQDPPGRVRRWLMQYEPAFIEYLLGDAADAYVDGALRRGLRLRRFDASRAFRDVTRVEVALPQDDLERFRSELEAYGFEAKAMEDGVRLGGAGVSVLLRATAGGGGIRSLGLKIEGGRDLPPTMVFGATSAIRIETDTTAVWRFQPGQE